LEDRRNVGENSCNCGYGTDQTGPILDYILITNFCALIIIY